MMTWTLSFETLAFIAIVAIMVALAVMVGGDDQAQNTNGLKLDHA